MDKYQWISFPVFMQAQQKALAAWKTLMATQRSMQPYRPRYAARPEDKPHVCPVPGCGKRFYRNFTMLRHQRLKHNAGGSNVTDAGNDQEEDDPEDYTADT